MLCQRQPREKRMGAQMGPRSAEATKSRLRNSRARPRFLFVSLDSLLINEGYFHERHGSLH